MRTPPNTLTKPLQTCGLFVLALALAAMSVSSVVARAQTPTPAASLDDILKQVSTYDGGIDSAAMFKLRDYVNARKDDPAGRAECEAKLLQFLKTSATPVAKMAVCRHLRVIGSDTAVPTLQAMLADERSADMALYALQQIPGGAAEGALVDALKTAKGSTTTAVIAALGERKATAAVPALVPLLTQPAFGGAAATALGRIGGDAATAALVTVYAGTSADLKPVVAASLLACAEAWLAAKNADAALRLFESLSSDASLPVPVRKAAVMGRISAAGAHARRILLEYLLEPGTPIYVGTDQGVVRKTAGASDPDMQEAAIAKVAEVFSPEAIEPVCALLLRIPERAQVQLLAVLSGYPADRVLPAVLQSARSDALSVRIAAMKALESTGGPSVVPFLAEAAAGARGPEQAAARSALGMLKGRAVDDAILALLGQQPPEGIAGELLLAVADRGIFRAKKVVAASLSSPSPAIRVQALKTLRAIGTPSDIPAVLDVLLTIADDRERTEAEKTTAVLARKIASPDGRSRMVKARLGTEKTLEARIRLINVLPLIGDSSALPLLRTALDDSAPEVVDAAVRAIAGWPTSAAREDVLRLARNSRNEIHRLLAIAGLVRSAGLDTYRNPAAAVADLKMATEFAWRPEEKKLVLGALVSFPCKDALDLAAGLLNDPAVKAEAQAAIDTITQRLAKDAGFMKG